MNGYKAKILNISVLILLICSIIIPTFLANPKVVHSATGMKQVIVHAYGSLVAGTSYNSFSGAGVTWNANENQVNQVVSFAGYVEKVYIRLSVAPGGVASWTFTLRKNGANTGIVIVLSGTETYDLDITNTVSYSAGDTIDWKVVDAGGPAASFAYISCYYVTAVDNTSIILGIGECSNVATRYGGLAQGYYGTVLVASVEQIRQIIPTAGTIKNFYVKLSVASGAGASWTLTVRKNGVNTALSVNLPNTTTGSDLVNTVSVAAGDIIDMEFLEVGACGANSYAGYGFTFVSSGVNGESILLSPSGTGLNAAASRYNSLIGGASWLATETSTYDLVQTCVLRNLYVRLSSAPDNGAGTQSFTIAMRLNAATQALTVTISEANQTGSDTLNSVSVTGGSFGNMIATPSGTPTVGYAQFGIVCYVDPTVYETPYGVASMYESLTSGGDAGGTACYGTRWIGQTFTAISAHSVTSVKILLQRTGTPGTLTLSIKETDAAGLPTGADLCSATYNGDILNTASYSWTEFIFTSERLEYGSKYALVLRALSGTAANYVQWYWDTDNGYAAGNAVESNDGGSYWYTLGVVTNDYLFQIWGTPAFDIIRAKVFKSYVNNGDWLIVSHYENFYTPYYEENADVSQLFVHQLVDGTTVLAETAVIQWGYMPGAIYLSADSVTSFEWGHDYIVRMYGNFSPYPYTDYQLVAADWIGSDLTLLDKWCRSTALLMESYYSADYTDTVAGKGIVLNEAGGVLFENGIPAISTVRKDLFKVASDKAPYTQDAYAHTLQKETIWQTKLGPVLTEAFTSFGNILSISGAWAVSLFIFILFAVVVAFSFAPGHAIGAIAIAFPLLILNWWIGVWALVSMAVLLSVVTFLIVWQFWLKGG